MRKAFQATSPKVLIRDGKSMIIPSTYALQLPTSFVYWQLRDLIISLIIRHIQPILSCHLLAQKATTDKMLLTLEELRARLCSRQTNQIIRHEGMPHFTLTLRPTFDIP